jgi:ankyrin repeat protein
MKPSRIAILLVIVAGTVRFTAQTSSSANDLDHLLLNAVENNDVSSARQLLDKGANIETRGRDRSTPLILAAEGADAPLIKMLLEKGANTDAKDHGGVSAIMTAARRGNPEIVELLLLQPTLDQKEKDRALFAAAGSEPAVVQIVDLPSGPDQPHDPGPTPKWESPSVKTVRLLLEHGAYLEARDPDHGTPLLRAASLAQTDIVAFLLERGADINARDKYGNTPLIAAACECALATMNDAYDIVKMLLTRGANPNAHAQDGTTALMNAAGGFGGSAIVDLLLASGADPTARDKKGNTALAIARRADRADKVKILKRAIGHAH